jgi:hypothetical protein
MCVSGRCPISHSFPQFGHLERERREAEFASQFAVFCYQFGPQFVYLLKSWVNSLLGQKVECR